MLSAIFCQREVIADFTILFEEQAQLPASGLELCQLSSEWAREFMRTHGDPDFQAEHYTSAINRFFDEKYREWIETVPARCLKINP